MGLPHQIRLQFCLSYLLLFLSSQPQRQRIHLNRSFMFTISALLSHHRPVRIGSVFLPICPFHMDGLLVKQRSLEQLARHARIRYILFSPHFHRQGNSLLILAAYNLLVVLIKKIIFNQVRSHLMQMSSFGLKNNIYLISIKINHFRIFYFGKNSLHLHFFHIFITFFLLIYLIIAASE